MPESRNAPFTRAIQFKLPNISNYLPRCYPASGLRFLVNRYSLIKPIHRDSHAADSNALALKSVSTLLHRCIPPKMDSYHFQQDLTAIRQ